MEQPDRGSFIDSKTIAAIVFCIGFLILWQGHMNKKYPPPTSNSSAPDTSKDIEPKTGTAVTFDQPVAISQTTKKEILFKFEGENFEFNISSFGMGLKDIKLKKYFDRQQKQVSFLSKQPLFATDLPSQKLHFEIQRENQNTFKGYLLHEGLRIRKTFLIDDKRYLIKTTTTIEGSTDIKLNFEENIVLAKKDIPLLPSYSNSSYLVGYGAKNDREVMLNDLIQQRYNNINLLSIESHYFTRAIIDNSNIKPYLEIEYLPSNARAKGSLVYTVPDGSKQIEIENLIYLGPKEKTALLNADSRLRPVLDYGFFAWIAHPIMDMIRLFFSWTQNWGIAIIMMTFVVRMALLPFNVMSHNSMKKMQKIQPQLKALQEKYKDDKVELNKATMEVMRNSGANPIGGCLPMLLQFPVFIALFKVLGVAIEFYQAPFLGWIDDLSQRDPYFILPVLMAGSMILHQKISPTTPDPKAKKIMLIMTIVFSLFMIVYPSGLALYIFIGSLFSIAQQLIMTKLEKLKGG